MLAERQNSPSSLTLPADSIPCQTLKLARASPDPATAPQRTCPPSAASPQQQVAGVASRREVEADARRKQEAGRQRERGRRSRSSSSARTACPRSSARQVTAPSRSPRAAASCSSRSSVSCLPYHQISIASFPGSWMTTHSYTHSNRNCPWDCNDTCYPASASRPSGSA